MFTVSADDDDSGDNKRISYEVANSDYFDIDDLGNVTVKKLV